MPLAFKHLPVTDMAGVTQNFEQLSQIVWPPTVTKLPSNPADGQIVCLQTTAMAELGVVWTLRYRAASTQTHKWEFVGGADLYQEGGEPEVTTSATPYTYSSVSIDKIAVPLAGEYDIQVSGSPMLKSASETAIYLGVWAGGIRGQVAFMIPVKENCGGIMVANARVGLAMNAEVTIGISSSSALQVIKIYYTTVRVRPVRLG